MKHNNNYYLLLAAFFLIILTSGCQKDIPQKGDTPQPTELLQGITNGSLTLDWTKPNEVKTVGSQNGYTLEVENKNVVDAQLSADGKTITITPKRVDRTVVYVTEKVTKLRQGFEVTVPAKSILDGEEYQKPKAPFELSWDKPMVIQTVETKTRYTASSSNPSVAKAEITDNGASLTITPIMKGSASITIEDQELRCSQTITVKVPSHVMADDVKPSYLISLLSPELTLKTLAVSGTTYAAVSDNPAIVEVTGSCCNEKFSFEGKSAGEATITITATDKASKNTTQDIKMKVVPGLLETLGMEEYTIMMEAPNDVLKLADKKLQYTATSSADDIVAVEVKDNSIVELEAKKLGTATITINETTKNIAQTLTVTVSQQILPPAAASKYTIILNNPTIKIPTKNAGKKSDEKNPKVYDYEITVDPSDASIATATLSEDKKNIVVTGVKEGEATITVKDKETNITRTIAIVVRNE